MIDPTAALTTPVATPLIPSAMDTFLHIGDLISLGHWAIVAIDKMGGPNLSVEIGEWFAGDWEEVGRAANALENLGTFCQKSSDAVNEELAALLGGWDGKAAAAAETYFSNVASQLSAMKANFDDIASQYETTAFGVKEFANAVGSLVESLIDYAIAAGISLAAAAASSWTVVGGIVGGGAAGYSIYKGAKIVAEILDIRAKVWTACEALLGLIAGSLSSLDGFTTEQLPGAYNNANA